MRAKIVPVTSGELSIFVGAAFVFAFVLGFLIGWIAA